MNLVVFPYICLYFLIGYFFSRAAEKETNDEVASALWFMIWPVIICLFVLAVLVSIPIGIYRRIVKIRKGI